MSHEGDPARAALRLFQEEGLRPKKTFGQNFLADAHAARTIGELATSPAGGTAIEIGAGLGALTSPLLARAARVVAIERDRDLCPILRRAFAPYIEAGSLTVVEADAKTLELPACFAGGARPWIVTGNLPYQITGPLLELITAGAESLDRAVFMVQEEVAERLLASPGTSAYGALTVFATAAFRIERALRVRRGAFHPQPNVDSAVIVLTPVRPRRASETEQFRQVVRAAFEQRRKRLRNAWSKLGPRAAVESAAAASGIDLTRRGETLSVEEFASFARALDESAT